MSTHEQRKISWICKIVKYMMTSQNVSPGWRALWRGSWGPPRRRRQDGTTTNPPRHFHTLGGRRLQLPVQGIISGFFQCYQLSQYLAWMHLKHNICRFSQLKIVLRNQVRVLRHISCVTGMPPDQCAIVRSLILRWKSIDTLDIWVILRCWGKSSLVYQQKSDAL